MSVGATPLRLYVEALGGSVQPVLDGRASFGLVGSLPLLPPGLLAEQVTTVGCTMVAAASHPLAAHRGMIGREELAKHVQLVLTHRSDLWQAGNSASCHRSPGGSPTCLPGTPSC
ncbi:LysR substrate-binding domain-containing protein [Falsiroseomonas sp.]|uniref:LysR substrate-binding domain-containing protein n=1 Tax=Falsiroseomonas sp. TaxID=2870721 RepID=UPI003F7144BD